MNLSCWRKVIEVNDEIKGSCTICYLHSQIRTIFLYLIPAYAKTNADNFSKVKLFFSLQITPAEFWELRNMICRRKIRVHKCIIWCVNYPNVLFVSLQKKKKESFALESINVFNAIRVYNTFLWRLFIWFVVIKHAVAVVII